MDFSSANVPIARDTWAPRSPPRAPPSGGYESRAYESRPPPPSGPAAGGPPAGPRRDADEGRYGNGAGGGGYGGGRDRPYDGPPRDRYDGPPPPSGAGAGGRDGEALHPPPARPRHAPARVEPTNVLGVFGLSVRTRERDLEDEFARYGEVEKVVIVYDQRTDRSRGFGFITMRTVEDAELCVEKLNGLLLHGRAVRVDFSATQRPHAPTPGEYLGVKRPIYEERGGYGRGGFDDRRGAPYGGGGRFDDRRDYGGRGGFDDRDRTRDRPFRSRDDDPYGGRSRREERDDLPPRKRSVSPDAGRRRYDDDDRRAPPPVRGYDAPAATEAPRY